MPAPTQSHPLPCMAEHSTGRPWTCKEKLLVTSIRKQAGYFHRAMDEGSTGQGWLIRASTLGFGLG